MKDNTMTDLLKELASLAVNQAPKEQILAKAWEAKVYLQEVWIDLGVAIGYIDSTVNAFAPDPSWQNGLPTDKIATPSTAQPPSASSSKPASTLTITGIEHILDVAKKVISAEGFIDTDNIVSQLKSDGDTRPDSDMKKSIGNILARYGYERIDTGVYKRINQEGQ